MISSAHRLWLLATLSILCNSCVSINLPESIKRGELRIEAPRTLPEKCYHLYNKGRSEDWFDCMGVGYK